MSNLSDIKNRMNVIADTRKITNAMDTVSVAKMSRAAELSEQNRTYFETLRGVISDIILHTSAWVHPCFKKRAGDRVLCIVIASDKGLAGGFNHGVCERAYSLLSECKAPTVIAVGQTTKEYFANKDGIALVENFCDRSFDPDIEDASEIADYAIKQFSSGDCDELIAVYNTRESQAAERIETIKILPLLKEDVCKFDSENNSFRESYVHELYYEPSPDEVLERLIPQYVSGIIYGCMLQSKAAEHSARHAAMSEATKNADELLSRLKLDYNRARQGAVTGEITDIITAASGVKNEKNF